MVGGKGNDTYNVDNAGKTGWLRRHIRARTRSMPRPHSQSKDSMSRTCTLTGSSDSTATR